MQGGGPSLIAQLVENLPAISACNIGDHGSIPGSGRSPGERDRLPTPVYWPEEFMDCIVHGLTKSQTQLNDFQVVCEMFRKVILVF